VNNVGFTRGSNTIETLKIDDFDKVMSVNVRSIVQLTQLCVPHLIKSKGNIVNISSVSGTRSFANILAYGVSKAALDQFTKSIALELADKGVRVNSVK
jgi:NAD(P)-dependent dehydrogenase (short-subunit alcohol dehydrogenase family)